MNKVALVTGASKGLGKAIVIELAKRHIDVVINYLHSENEAKNLAEFINKNYGVSSLVIKADVGKEDEVENMFQQIAEKYQKLDYLINNAAIANDSVFLDKTKEDFLNVYSTNLVGPFLCSKHAHKLMPKTGCIVNISSTNAIDTFYTYSADYDCSKAALISLSNNLAVELAPIRVNTIAPGWINTSMNKDLEEEFSREEKKKILLNRFAEPSEIAKVVSFLCSEDASYINKSVIRVDGGFYE